MITLKDFMEAINYKITEGSDYLWSCYGSNSYRLDGTGIDIDDSPASIIFDTETQVVYEVTVYDYQYDRAYRMINPDYVKKVKKEAKKRQVDFNQAWDDINYTDLEVEEDFLEKLQAILAGEDYDTKISIPIELSDKELALIARAAHTLDMTLNEFFEHAIMSMMTNIKEQNDINC